MDGVDPQENVGQGKGRGAGKLGSECLCWFPQMSGIWGGREGKRNGAH